jgi:hypothetical protein
MSAETFDEWALDYLPSQSAEQVNAQARLCRENLARIRAQRAAGLLNYDPPPKPMTSQEWHRLWNRKH